MRRAVLLVLLVICGLLAVLASAVRFEDERMVYARPQLAVDPHPSGVVEPVNWRAVGAVATVIGAASSSASWSGRDPDSATAYDLDRHRSPVKRRP
jgi:hypothetical protein